MNKDFEEVLKSIDVKFDRFMKTLNDFVKKVIKEVNNLKELIKSKQNSSEGEKSFKKTEVESVKMEKRVNKNIYHPAEEEGGYSLEFILWEVANFKD